MTAKSDAERKALQRAGYQHWNVLVHPKSVAQALLAEGLITEAQLEDDDAMREALANFITRHCQVGRILRDETEPPTLPARRMSGGSFWSPTSFSTPAHHGRTGPWRAPGKKKDLTWTEEDTEAWESGKLGYRLFNCRPGYSGYVRGDSIGAKSWRESPHFATTVLSECPPDWAERRRSGDRDGRNRGRIVGSFKSEQKTSKAKRIKQMREPELKKREKPYADELKVKSTSPHFVQLSGAEVERMHGLRGFIDKDES
jgi:hypothetical protein